MEKCRVRAATYDDVPAIMRFINQYWKKDHILAQTEHYLSGNI